MVCGGFKDLNRRTAAHKVLHDKTFNIAKNPKCDGYQRGLASMVYNFFNKNASGGAVKNEIISNKELDSIWGADLADMQLIRIKRIKDDYLDFYYAILAFIANMHGLFL